MSQSTALAQVATRLSVSTEELQSIVMQTVMPANKEITNEQFVSFIAVANEYQLNPLVKEIYAFPAKGGGIQPIVSIDGWLRIINSHKQFDGMEHEDQIDANGNLVAIKCSIYRKDTKRPITVTEYMGECAGNSEPWKKWPARMLRHKATIQAGRYAFGISGIIDPDEAERFADAGVIEPEKPKEPERPIYSNEDFKKNFDAWQELIEKGEKKTESIINKIKSRFDMTQEQVDALNNIQNLSGGQPNENA